MAGQRVFKYSREDIARITKQSIKTVSRHYKEGKVDLTSLESVARYIAAKLLENPR